MTPTTPVIRYHGGKFRLAPWVMRHFPPHRIYVEPFGGAAGVLIQKPRAFSEVYNDLDDEMTNLFRVMQDPDQRGRLVELLVFTPYARAEFERAWEPAEEPVERARRLVIRAQMGFGSAGATKGTTGFRIDAKREYETAQHSWAKYPDNLAAVGRRLAGVLIENCPAIKILRNHDTPDTLFYVDPPYVHETRVRITSKDSPRGYRHEMDLDDHAALLAALQAVQGMVVLSGYPHPLYDDALRGWARRTTKARISGAKGTTLRDEVLWLNPACCAALQGGGLFSITEPT
ncbi:MAG: DNA adenine methylase [Rhodocyclaceae bacterium]|nr:DNA adenine methylase [Rhodocyclaceae bacterium]